MAEWRRDRNRPSDDDAKGEWWLTKARRDGRATVKQRLAYEARGRVKGA